MRTSCYVSASYYNLLGLNKRHVANCPYGRQTRTEHGASGAEPLGVTGRNPVVKRRAAIASKHMWSGTGSGWTTASGSGVWMLVYAMHYSRLHPAQAETGAPPHALTNRRRLAQFALGQYTARSGHPRASRAKVPVATRHHNHQPARYHLFEAM